MSLKVPVREVQWKFLMWLISKGWKVPANQAACGRNLLHFIPELPEANEEQAGNGLADLSHQLFDLQCVGWLWPRLQSVLQFPSCAEFVAFLQERQGQVDTEGRIVGLVLDQAAENLQCAVAEILLKIDHSQRV